MRCYSVFFIVLLLSACSYSKKNATEEADPLKAAQINTELGFGYLRQGEVEIAISKFERAISYQASSISAHYALGLAYEQQGKVGLAEEYFQRALKLDEQDSAANNNYGTFLCRQQRLLEAEKYFLAALKDPKYQTPELAYLNAALCVKKIPDHPKAEVYLKKVLDLNPKVPVALYHMADIQYAKQNYLSARAYLQRYMELGSADARVLWLGFEVEKRLGDAGQAKLLADKILKEFPASEEAQKLKKTLGPELKGVKSNKNTPEKPASKAIKGLDIVR